MEKISHPKGKIYYSMGEVSEMFDVNPSLIRFWESKFDILKPHKNKKGNRLFTPEDVDNLKLIYHLVKEKGMTLTGAQKLIKENKEGTQRDMEVVDRLLAIRAMLLEIKQELKMGSDDTFLDDEYNEPEVPVSPTIKKLSDKTKASAEVSAKKKPKQEDPKKEPETGVMFIPLIDKEPQEPTTGTIAGNMDSSIEAEIEEAAGMAGERLAYTGNETPEPTRPEELPVEGFTADEPAEVEGADPNIAEELSYEEEVKVEEPELAWTEDANEQKALAEDVMETISEMEGTAEDKPRPRIIEQTLF